MVDQVAVDFVWQEHPRRVNVGCGWDRRDGYLNIDLHDFHSPDLVGDVRNLDMLPAGEYDEIIAQDVLEHLERRDAAVALNEWARILRIGGQLVVRVPDLMGLFAMMSDSEDLDHQTEIVHLLFGTQAYTGDFHLNGFTEPLLRQALHDAGFDVVSLTGLHGWLFDVVAQRVESPTPIDPADYVRPNGSVARADAHSGAPASAPQSGSAISGIATVPLPHVSLYSTSVGSSSRVPGGGLPHRIFSRLLARHGNAMSAQFDTYQRAIADRLARTEERLDAVERALG